MIRGGRRSQRIEYRAFNLPKERSWVFNIKIPCCCLDEGPSKCGGRQSQSKRSVKTGELSAGKLGFVHLGTFRGPLFLPTCPQICHPCRSPVVPQRGVACGCPGRWGHALTNVLTIASHWLPTKRGFPPFTPSITISLRTSKRPSAPLSATTLTKNCEAAEFWGRRHSRRSWPLIRLLSVSQLLDFACDVVIAASRVTRAAN